MFEKYLQENDLAQRKTKKGLISLKLRMRGKREYPQMLSLAELNDTISSPFQPKIKLRTALSEKGPMRNQGSASDQRRNKGMTIAPLVKSTDWIILAQAYLFLV